MLPEFSPTPLLPVQDMDRARAFYEECLGLRPVGMEPDGKVVYAFGDSTLALLPDSENTPDDHTAISFRVADIVAAIAELERSGVLFEDYDLPGLRTVDHVGMVGPEKAAWFKDPEGNWLCIHEDLVDA